MRRNGFLILVCLLLGACTGSACLKDQPYQSARTFPPLRAPAGVQAPAPDPNMDIPQVDGGVVGKFPEGEGYGPAQLRCLQTPPRYQPEGQAG